MDTEHGAITFNLTVTNNQPKTNEKRISVKSGPTVDLSDTFTVYHPLCQNWKLKPPGELMFNMTELFEILFPSRTMAHLVMPPAGTTKNYFYLNSYGAT